MNVDDREPPTRTIRHCAATGLSYSVVRLFPWGFLYPVKTNRFGPFCHRARRNRTRAERYTSRMLHARRAREARRDDGREKKHRIFTSKSDRNESGAFPGHPNWPLTEAGIAPLHSSRSYVASFAETCEFPFLRTVLPVKQSCQNGPPDWGSPQKTPFRPPGGPECRFCTFFG